MNHSTETHTPVDWTQTVLCPHCTTAILITGKDIHYCVTYQRVGRRRQRICNEYVACYDGREIGAGFRTYLEAEVTLDEHVHNLHVDGMLASAQALDGGSSDAEIAADVAPFDDVCTSCREAGGDSPPAPTCATCGGTHFQGAVCIYCGTSAQPPYASLADAASVVEDALDPVAAAQRLCNQAYALFLAIDKHIDRLPPTSEEWSRCLSLLAKASERCRRRMRKHAALASSLRNPPPAPQMIALAVGGPDQTAPPVDNGPADNWGGFRSVAWGW